MSATSQITPQVVTDWVKLFPRTVTETYTSSVTFMKQLTVVAVSTITYLKNVFPEDSYNVESFGGIRLRVLKQKCSDELANFVSTALTQAFEAFEKKYLHQLALCFYDGECKLENLIEYHIFEFSYNTDGVTMDLHSKNRDSVKRSSYSFDNVRERTMNLIRTCVVVMQTAQNELPTSFDVSLRLYYNDTAPEGYQAPGFCCTAESRDHLEPTLGDTMKLGLVETPYHRLVARTFIKDLIGSSHEANPSQNPPVMTQQDEDITDTVGSERSAMESASPSQVRCECGKENIEEYDVMLTCMYCEKQQHAACYGVRGPLARHCCAACGATRPPHAHTDPRLATLSHRKQKCLCIFRRALVWVEHVGGGAGDAGGEGGGGGGGVCGAGLAHQFGVSHVSAAKMVKLLHSHGVVRHDTGSDLNAPLEINPDQLKNTMSKFFQNEETNIVERLLADTFSQESQPDPIGDALGPMEATGLQNASALGRIVAPEKPNTAIEDATLKQYREAILSNLQVDDLSINGSDNPIKDIENIAPKKSLKRKTRDAEEMPLKTGVRTKKAKKILPK